jgi:hypothetical protein
MTTPLLAATPLAARACPTPYEVLLGDIDLVIGEWRALVGAEPWAQLPADRLIDSLPELLPKIIRLAAAGATAAPPELGEMIAEAHGFFRRGDRLPLTAVAEEWAFVRRACAAVLARRGVDPAAAADAVARLEVLLDEAVGYSLRGYYAPELDVLRGRGLERRQPVDDRRSGSGSRRRAD